MLLYVFQILFHSHNHINLSLFVQLLPIVWIHSSIHFPSFTNHINNINDNTCCIFLDVFPGLRIRNKIFSYIYSLELMFEYTWSQFCDHHRKQEF